MAFQNNPIPAPVIPKWWQPPYSPFTKKLILGVLTVIGGGTWYVFSSHQEQKTTNSPASVNIQAAGNVENVNINTAPLTNELVEKYEQQLKKSDDQLKESQRQLKESREQIDDLKASVGKALEALKTLPARNIDIKPLSVKDAFAEIEKGNTKLAKEIFRSVLKSKLNKGKTLEAAEAARHLGALALLDNNKEALDAYEQAVQLDPDNLEGQNQLAHVLLGLGELRKAEAVLLKILDIAEKNRDVDGQAIAIQNLGIIYDADGKVHQAIEMAQRGLKLNESRNRLKGVATNLNSLAIGHFKLHDFNLAEEYAHKSIAAYKQIPRNDFHITELAGFADSITTLANIYQVMGHPAEAEKNFCTALDIYQKAHNTQRVAGTYFSLGSIYESRGDTATAKTLYERSRTLNSGNESSRLHTKIEAAFKRMPKKSGKSKQQVCSDSGKTSERRTENSELKNSGTHANNLVPKQ